VNAIEIKRLIDDEFIDCFRAEEISQKDEMLVIKGWVISPVSKISSLLYSDEDIEIKDEEGEVLGILLSVSWMVHSAFCALSEYKQMAFLADADPWADINSGNIRFSTDYLLIPIIRYGEYIHDFKNTSPIWGGYSHKNNSLNNDVSEEDSQCIIAKRNVLLPTNHHFVSAEMATHEPFAFQAYLKLYHLLELSFDLELVKSIKNLGDDLKGIGKLLIDSHRKERDILQNLFKKYINVNSDIEKALEKAFEPKYWAKIKEIMFEYEKDGNPLKDVKKLNRFDELATLGKLSEVECHSKKIETNQDDYELFVIKLITYYVYRIRCCIAHNRIGEYVMCTDDEPMILNVMIPLIRELLCQIYKQNTKKYWLNKESQRRHNYSCRFYGIGPGCIINYKNKGKRCKICGG